MSEKQISNSSPLMKLLLSYNRFGLSQAEAGVCNSLVYFVGAVSSPVAGAIIDKTGKNVLWCKLP